MSKIKAIARFRMEDTIEKLRQDIEKIHAAGSYPHDYSLGFTNGVIFADHRLNCRKGEPKFYDQRTSIGELPRPVQFKHEAAKLDLEEKKYEELIDQLLIDAQVVTTKLTDDPSVKDLKETIAKLNDFLEAEIGEEKCPA